MRVGVLTNILPPYRIGFYNELARLCDLHVVLDALSTPHGSGKSIRPPSISVARFPETVIGPSNALASVTPSSAATSTSPSGRCRSSSGSSPTSWSPRAWRAHRAGSGLRIGAWHPPHLLLGGHPAYREPHSVFEAMVASPACRARGRVLGQRPRIGGLRRIHSACRRTAPMPA